MFEVVAGAYPAVPTAPQELADGALISVVDLHADVLYRLWQGNGVGTTDRLDAGTRNLMAGQSIVQVYPVFVPPKDSDYLASGKAQVLLFKRVILASGQVIEPYSIAQSGHRPKGGTIWGILAMEGAHALGDDERNLDWYAQNGLRILGLTWNNSNVFARGVTDQTWSGPGLTGRGIDLLRRMEKWGLVADLAHAHWDTFWDVITKYHGPVMVSHAGARALMDIPRNLDDEQLLALGQKRGIMGIVYHSGFLAHGRQRIGISEVYRHVQHLLWVGGESLPALGSDFDGGIRKPAGIESAADIPQMLVQIANMGLGESMAGQLASRNAMEFFHRAGTDFHSFKPLSWRPLPVQPGDAQDKMTPVFDRLSTTSVRLCKANRSQPISVTFSTGGKGARALAIRCRSDSGGSISVSVLKKSNSPIARTQCKGDGSRCLIWIGQADTRGEQYGLEVQFHDDSGQECLDLMDIVPLDVWDV